MATELGWLNQALAVAGFFALRVLVPLLVVALLALGLRRVDHRWQLQAEGERRRALEVLPAQVPNPVAGLRCYEQHSCTEEQRSHCEAATHPNTPCWLSRHAAEGALPSTCVSCGIYRNRAEMLPALLPAVTVHGANPAA